MLLSENKILYIVVLVSIVFFILIIAFIAFIILNVRKRQKKEIEKLQAIIAAEDNERSRIAKDLHDDLGPLLSGIKLQVNLLGKNSSPEQLDSVLNDTSKQLDSAIQNVRYVVRNLMPPGLEKYGLIKSIADFQSIISKNKNCQFDFKHSGFDSRLAPAAELNIFRIVHELINNSLKHSSGTYIRLNLQMNNDKVILHFEDDGRSDNSIPTEAGMGLGNISSRVNLFNGKLEASADFSMGASYKIEFNTQKLRQ